MSGQDRRARNAGETVHQYVDAMIAEARADERRTVIAEIAAWLCEPGFSGLKTSGPWWRELAAAIQREEYKETK